MDQQPAKYPTKQNDFDIYLKDVDLDEYKRKLFKYNYPVETLEKISYLKEQYEIFQLDINESTETKRLLIFTGVHGNEFAPVLAVTDILEDIQQSPEAYSRWSLRIITPLNPVGVAYQSRYNESGKDINRDFKDFSTLGARLQKQAVSDFKPDIIISMHEGPQNGFFVIADGNLGVKLEKHLKSNLRNASVKLAKKSFLGLKIADGFWRKPKIIYLIQAVLRIYTFGRYAHEHGYTLLTTESTWSSRDLEDRKRPHVEVIRAITLTD